MVKHLNITGEDIAQYIQSIDDSGVLGRSKRKLRLLDHLIRSQVAGDGDRLKAYSIALDIFGKTAEFDPTSDSVVRVEMGRLRNGLTLFEASDFAKTRLKVEIPVGTYQPVLNIRQGYDGADTPVLTVADAEATPPKNTNGSKYLLIAGCLLIAALLVGWFAFDPLSTPSEKRAISVQVNVRAGSDREAERVKFRLSSALSRSKTIILLDQDASGSRRSDATFIVDVRFARGDGSNRINVELFEAADGRLIWSRSLEGNTDETLSYLVEDRLARELRVRLFGASKDILTNLPVEDLSPEALFVLATWVPGSAQSAIEWEEQRIGLARLALEGDPQFGAAHSVLADKLAYLANVYGPSNTVQNLEAARYHAERAVDLSPLDPDVMFNVAQSHWHSGRIRESRAFMGRVIELDPGHDLARFLHAVIPYTCAVAPDEVLAATIAFDAELSPDNPIRWLTLTWVGWLHAYRQEWEAALVAEEAAARIFQIPYSFMRRAMVLNQLGRTSDAERVLATQNVNWASFEPAHFVNVTIPRLCSETPDPDLFVGYYADLLDDLPKLLDD